MYFNSQQLTHPVSNDPVKDVDLYRGDWKGKWSLPVCYVKSARASRRKRARQSWKREQSHIKLAQAKGKERAEEKKKKRRDNLQISRMRSVRSQLNVYSGTQSQEEKEKAYAEEKVRAEEKDREKDKRGKNL
jgi:hypothetical protein